MDACSEPGIWKVIVMSSAQVGKSEILLNVAGFYIDQDPAPIMMLQPTISMAEAFSRDRIATMIRDTPALAEVVADPKSKSGGNTLLYKQFEGGHLTLAGANSPASLAMRPIRVLLMDEPDRYPPSAGIEGDPGALAEKRTITFHNRLIMLTSTPTVKGASKIEFEYEESDQRRFFMPCINCGQMQHLTWKQIKWDQDIATNPHDVWLECLGCAAELREVSKAKMTKAGKWIATNDNGAVGVAGFHLNELVSPWRTWENVRDDFITAKKDPELLRVWVNTSMGETFEETGQRVESEGLLGRRVKYEAEVPASVLVLTAGVDFQDDRAEVTVDGWGEGEENPKIAHIIIHGDPDTPELWNALDDVLLHGVWQCEGGGELKIAASCLDTGHKTTAVYAYVKKHKGRRIFAIKGIGGEGKPFVGNPARRRYGKNKLPVELYPLGVDGIKRLIYRRLSAGNDSGPGAIIFPITSDFDDEYFKQLTAEEQFTKFVKGAPVRYFKQTRPRNEALDCSVYSYAAMIMLKANWSALARKRAKYLQNKNITTIAPDEEVETKATKPKRKIGGGRRRPGRRGWMNDF